MAWLAVDKNGDEYVYEVCPMRNIRGSLISMFTHPKDGHTWYCGGEKNQLPKGSIEKLIERPLTWKDAPVELKEDE